MLALLRKLGILRYGTKSYTYTSGKDMPAEALMHDVIDAEKDLVNKGDIDKARKALKTPRGKTVLKWVILGVGGFLAACFVLGFLFGSDEPSGQEQASVAKAAPATATASRAAQSQEQSQRRPVTAADEINGLFASLRQANLEENIDTFMTYYAVDFPDRAGKEQKTLETWQRYDFVSLDFFVFDLQVSGDRAQASVGWEIALLEKGAGEPRLIETTNQVALKRGGSGWQIVSLQ